MEEKVEKKECNVVDYKAINKEKEKAVEFANIDKDILEIALSENVYESFKDETKRKRVLVNFLAEFLASLRKVDKHMEEVVRQFTICSYDKVFDFFMKTKDNIEKEQKNKQKAKAIVEQSHKKPMK